MGKLWRMLWRADAAEGGHAESGAGGGNHRGMDIEGSLMRRCKCRRRDWSVGHQRLVRQ